MRTKSTLLTLMALVIAAFPLTSCGKGKKNAPPVAVATASHANENQPLNVDFSSVGTIDPDGTISSYSWTFGDGKISAEQNPTHMYEKSGTYTATLTVTDDHGNLANTTITVGLTTPASSVIVGSSVSIAELAGVAKLSIEPGTLPSGKTITLSTTSRSNTASDFEITSAIFGDALRSSYEIRVNTGTVKPAKTIAAEFVLPNELLDHFRANDEPHVFVQIYENGGSEVLDSFELIDSDYNSATHTLKMEITPDMFTELRTSDKSFEVIVIVGATQTKPTSASSHKSSSLAFDGSLQEKTMPPPSIAYSPNSARGKLSALTFAENTPTPCDGATLRPPLSTLTVNDPYAPPSHYGTDYKADDGTDVMAMSDGKIFKVGFNSEPLAQPDPRSGKKVKGWGHYIVITHTDGSQSLYAHLEDGQIKVKAGQAVKAGDVIALSDNSGGSSGPHLHVEYAPNGQIFKKASKVDPDACMGANVKGNITIRDNGNIADDSFSLSVNGVLVCSTTIGNPNTCALGNLRSGTVTATLTCLVAPDNVGTYELSLDNGLKFTNGQTTVSSTLAQGESVNYDIIVP